MRYILYEKHKLINMCKRIIVEDIQLKREFFEDSIADSDIYYIAEKAEITTIFYQDNVHQLNRFKEIYKKKNEHL